MKPEEILAVVVSFNGGAKTVETVQALRGQVGHVHVVDNGSTAASLALLEALEALPGVSVRRLPENQGIGAALNAGLERAREGGYRWLLTMDQDSRADPGMVEAFRRSAVDHPDRECLAPTLIVNGVRGSAGDAEVRYAITSGSIVDLRLLERVGPFDESMFIDCVDFDFCLRVRAGGGRIFRVGDALLHHELGERRQVPGPLARFYTQHPPARRYYMFRNYCVLAMRHGRRFPGFIVKLGAAHVILAGLILVHDEGRRESFSAIVEGIGDFLRGRTGRRGAGR
jgi:rhamnosyltransferase